MGTLAECCGKREGREEVCICTHSLCLCVSVSVSLGLQKTKKARRGTFSN